MVSGAASGEVTVVGGGNGGTNGNNSGTSGADDVDDAYCRCTPSTTGTASKNQTSSSLNNNKAQGAGVSPYLVSAATSPRKKHTRTVMTASGTTETTKTLPPLDLNRTVLHGNGALLHHHSTRRSARKSSRGHTVPVMSLNSSNKRSHSAASTQEDNLTPVTPPPTAETTTTTGASGVIGGRRSRNHQYRGHSHSPERKSSKVLCTPEKLARRGHHIYNKIETVRILRARPAFYPIRDRVSATSSTKSSAKSIHRSLDPGSLDPELLDSLPRSPILGKHITLRMDRSELKRKRRIAAAAAAAGGSTSAASTSLALPPATTSTHFT